MRMPVLHCLTVIFVAMGMHYILLFKGGLQATEYKSILKVLPVALNGLMETAFDEHSLICIGQRLSRCLLRFLDFYVLFLASKQEENSSLVDLQRAAMEFRRVWREDLHAYQPSEFEMPKFHGVTHAPDQIRKWGAHPVCEADHFER